MTKNTQGSEWRGRFSQLFEVRDHPMFDYLMISQKVANPKAINLDTFIDQEITASNKALLQKVREIVGDDIPFTETDKKMLPESCWAIEVQNAFRAKLRTKLDELEREI